MQGNESFRAAEQRSYSPSDVRTLMENTGSWARSWDDVLYYLEGARSGATDVPALVDDVRHLKEERIGFTTDYRVVWQELTGENASHLPPSEPDPSTARSAGNASSRVIDVLQRVQSREYQEMAGLTRHSRNNRRLDRH